MRVCRYDAQRHDHVRSHKYGRRYARSYLTGIAGLNGRRAYPVLF